MSVFSSLLMALCVVSAVESVILVFNALLRCSLSPVFVDTILQLNDGQESELPWQRMFDADTLW